MKWIMLPSTQLSDTSCLHCLLRRHKQLLFGLSKLRVRVIITLKLVKKKHARNCQVLDNLHVCVCKYDKMRTGWG